jgi:hypothetical protein
MQTFDLSGTAPKTENRFRNLFWPSVQTATDVDSLGAQGYWICVIITVLDLITTIFSGVPAAIVVGVFVALLYYVGGVGVRQHSCFAAIVVFAFFVLNMIGNPIVGLFGISLFVVKIIVSAILLSNIRATFIASFWERGTAEAEMPVRFGETWGDKFVDRFPAWLWPKVRIGYYIYSSVLMLLITLGLGMAYIMRHYPFLIERLRANR